MPPMTRSLGMPRTSRSHSSRHKSDRPGRAAVAEERSGGTRDMDLWVERVGGTLYPARVMRRVLFVADHLEAGQKAHIEKDGLARLWLEARPLSGGRGSARLADLGARQAVIKRERRGGLLAFLMPDWYLLEGPFRKEWSLGLRLAGLGLSPHPLAQELWSRGPFFKVHIATEFLPHAASLLARWRAESLKAESLRHVGAAVGRLHRAGVVHGDLNAGNIMIVPEGGACFLDLRHSRSLDGQPCAGDRHRNLARLARSLHKLRATQGLSLPVDAWHSLAEGYASGWGAREPWITSWLRRVESGYPLRGLLWRKVPSVDD